MFCGGWIDMRTDRNTFFRQCDVDYMQFLKDPQGGKNKREKVFFCGAFLVQLFYKLSEM